MATIAPLRIERNGLWAVIHNGHPYKATLQSVGAKWRADNTWHLPLTVANLNQLSRAGVPIQTDDPALKIASEQPWLVPARKTSHVDHPNWPKLYPYQQQAVDFLCHSPYPGTLLALSPGLGKTPTAIVAAELLDMQSVLVLCPRVLIPVWKQERERWATLPWNDPKQTVLRPFVVGNWEYYLKHPDELEIDWSLVILDESVLVKNRQTQRFKLAKKLRKRAEHMWLLSGSPITRYVDDLWTQLHLCFPDAFTSYWRFVNTWCYVYDNPWGGKDITGSRNYNFPQEFKDLQFTKNQAEVLPDLPDFIEQNIPVELCGEQKKLYDRALNEFLVDLDGQELPIPTRIAQLTRLQQLVSHPANCDGAYKGTVAKLDALLELLDTRAVDLPLLVWTFHRTTAIEVTQALYHQGLRAGYVIGGMNDAPETILQQFKDGDLDALVLSLGVGKYGLTLTNAKTVVYYDKTWDADSWVQSLSRVRRIGLDHVFHIVNLHASHTTDDLVVDNLAEKAQSIARVSNADLAAMLRAL
jgi:SNF2 family DNA or RNA helicase